MENTSSDDHAARREMPATHGPGGRPRARGIGLRVPGKTGPANSITDVPGVAVGYTTLIDAEKPIRTGVTAILPRESSALLHPVWAGSFSMNGNGEMTGLHWIRESGWFTGPITLTNTFSIGIAHQATARWMAHRFADQVGEELWVLPVATETYDGYLNDIAGFHVTEAHVHAAIDGAQGGPISEGSVGGGTGMIAYEFKGGTGTSSRRVSVRGGSFTLGTLVQANHGVRPWLTIYGVGVGQMMTDNRLWSQERGSIVVVLATDLPLLPTQLDRLARRAALGIGRGGTPSGNNSGDIFLAFSTANDPGPLPEPSQLALTALSNDDLDPIFLAVVEAVEEAVLNAMLAADSMTGKHGRRVVGLDPGQLMGLMSQHGR